MGKMFRRRLTLGATAWLFAALPLLSFLLLPASNVQGEENPRWADDADRRIEQLRKGRLRVLVLNRRGTPVPRCEVTVSMQRHTFPFGMRLSREAIAKSPSLDQHKVTPVWRAFNTLAMDAVTSWPNTQPKREQWDFKHVDGFVDWAKRRKMNATWGSLISADRGRLPAWAAELSPAELRRAIVQYRQRVFDRYEDKVTHIDVLTHTLDHRYITQQLGVAMARDLYHTTDQRNVHAIAAFDNAFRADRLTAMVRRITKMREQFIPFDSVAVGVTFRDSVNPHQMLRSLKVMGNLKLNLAIKNLQVGGEGDLDAAQNLEKVLRALFADPHVKSITMAGVFPDELEVPAAALIDQDGEPTAAGMVFDQMVTNLWWTQVNEKADGLGNLRVRVFAGEHRVSAKLPTGEVIESTMYIKPGNDEQLIVLQPTRADKPVEQMLTEVETD